MAMKLPSNVMKFAADTGCADAKLYTKFQDYFFHYMSEVGDRKIGAYDASVPITAKEAEVFEDFVTAVEGVANVKFSDGNIDQLMMNPMVKYAYFGIINSLIDAVLPMTIIDSIGLYSEIRNIGFGDSAHFEIKPRSLFTVSQAGNAQRTVFVQKQFSTDKTLIPVNHAVTVQVSMYKVLSGKESLAEFVRKAIIAIETEMTKDAYGALTTALNAATMPAALKVTGYTVDNLISICETVTAYNQGAKATIVGTAAALSKILPNGADGYRIITDATDIRIGLIRNFFGYDVITLPQIATGDYSKFDMALKSNEIYVISPSSEKLIKIVTEGSTLTNSNDFYENANLTQNATINKRWACEFVSNAVAGMITLQ